MNVLEHYAMAQTIVKKTQKLKKLKSTTAANFCNKTKQNRQLILITDFPFAEFCSAHNLCHML